MRQRWLMWAMTALYVPGVMLGLPATLFGAWDATQGGTAWDTVGYLAAGTAAFLVPGRIVEGSGRRRWNGRKEWWFEDQLALDDLKARKPETAEFGAFTTTAITQMLSSLSEKTDIEATDSILRQYWTVEGVNWREIRAACLDAGVSVPPFAGSYWARKGVDEAHVPLSVVAFLGFPMRKTLAHSNTIPAYVRDLLRADPSPQISLPAAAQRRSW